MNTIWSTYLQGIGTLYDTRSLRFSDVFKDQYQNVFAIENKRKILEIGCGPGALAESLFRWYPKAQIYGVIEIVILLILHEREIITLIFQREMRPIYLLRMKVLM